MAVPVEEQIERFLHEVDSYLESFNSDKLSVHPFDVREILIRIRDIDENIYFDTLRKIPNDLLAEVMAELPDFLQEEASELLGVKKLAKITTQMDTDDAADFLQNISEFDTDKAENVLGKINPKDQEVIRSLISYEEDTAGSYMQSELFAAKENDIIEDAIVELRKMKQNDKTDGLNKIFIVKEDGGFICSIGLEELVLSSPKDKLKDILEKSKLRKSEIVANHLEDIKHVVERVCDYNLSVIPVVNGEGILIGRITSDDIYDLIENQATDEMYGLAGLNVDIEQSESLIEAARSRATWLGINLITAISASVVVALFDKTISSFVSLAILMPIVASMGGNAGTQSLTITVRQLSLGEIDYDNAIDTIKKEVLLSLINGFLFAIVIGMISYLWFGLSSLGIVIALSTVINLFVAGLSGSMIPLILEKFDIDPAIASSVLLTTVTDIIGFFSFLGLAKILM